MKHMRIPVAMALTWSLIVAPSQAGGPSINDRTAVHAIARELKIFRVLDRLSAQANRGTVIFRDVSVVDVVQGRVTPHQTVVTANGFISWVGENDRAPKPEIAAVVDGRGLFLSPGLTDMHVHTQSLSEQLLRLATGITSVRDMDGFPWMLRLRRAVRAGRLLAPSAYVAGTIITDYPLSGYAVVVKTEEEARRQVRDQTTCGYDFIKVHNHLSQSLFDAISDQARLSGEDLVGHIPHDISIDHAVHVGGMRTLEHLKGFINDRNFAVSGEDYAAALRGAQVWITPTFYILRSGDLHDEVARRELARPEMRYVSAARRADWNASANIQPDWHDRLAAMLPEVVKNLLPLNSPLLMQERLNKSVPSAMSRLLPLHPRWLAGTDSAFYNFQIPGYALLDELVLMQQHGIARSDVLQAATSQPAAAMHHSDEFGQIKPGMRADLVLLASDPEKNLSTYRANRGVMVAGVWIDRSALDAALKELARIQSESDSKFAVDEPAANALAAEVLQLSGKDIALDPKLLTPAVTALRDWGYASAAKTLMNANTDSTPGPCQESLPGDGD